MSKILDFHAHPKAEARWANMERHHLIVKGEIDGIDDPSVSASDREFLRASYLHKFGLGPDPLADTAPCELSFGHQDGDVA